MSASPTTTPATDPSSPPPAVPSQSQPSRFEDFMSASIGAALKENPQLPSTSEEDGKEAPPRADEAAEPAKSAFTKDPNVKADLEQKEETPLLPDFTKLAFGEKAAERVTDALATEPLLRQAEKSEVYEVPPPESFPEKLPGKSTLQVQEAWASLRKANTALYHQNTDLSSKLKQITERLKDFEGKTPMDKGEYDRITNERDEVVKELRLSKLEATPEYKLAVAKPWEQIENEIKRLSNKYSLNEHQVRRAIIEGDPDKQSEMLGSLTDTFNDRDKLNLFKLADSAVEVAHKREILQKDVKQALDYIESKHQAEEEARVSATKSEWNTSLAKAWETLENSLYLARPVPGNDDWNNSLTESKQMVAKTDLAALSSTDRAKVLIQAALLPRACIAINQLWSMYTQANTALKRYQGATPGAGSGGSGAGVEPSPPQAGDEMGFIDAVEQRLRGR